MAGIILPDRRIEDLHAPELEQTDAEITSEISTTVATAIGNIVHTVDTTKTNAEIQTLIDATPKPIFITNSGRFYLFAARNWVTTSDDNYGANYYQFAESAGISAEPIYEWEHLGDVLEAGTKLNKLKFVCRGNNIAMDAMDIRIVVRMPLGTQWDTGWGSDNHLENHVLVSEDNYALPSVGTVTDLRRYTFDLGGYVMPRGGMVSIYLRQNINSALPVDAAGTPLRHYLLSTWTWEVSV